MYMYTNIHIMCCVLSTIFQLIMLREYYAYRYIDMVNTFILQSINRLEIINYSIQMSLSKSYVN